MPRGHGPFAFWNKTGNRLVRSLLSSPLHRLVSARLALITVTGRRSGNEHTFPVGYRQQGELLTIPVVWPQRKLWWRNLREGAQVRVRLRGADRTGHGGLRGDERSELSVEVQLDPRS